MTLTASVETGSYCEPMMGSVDATWPAAGLQLLAELAAARGRYVLVEAVADAADHLCERLAIGLDLQIVRLGAALSGAEQPPTAGDVEAACGSATILSDLDVLLWPALGVPALPFLATRARRRPVIAVWPGVITGGRARYSSPGRPDHHDARLSDVVVLRPRTTRFPDEVPYQIERIAQ